MKHLLKKIIPSILLELYSKNKYDKKASQYEGKTSELVFTDIYNTNKWGNKESVSGIGSTLENTKQIIKEINKILIQ